MGAKPVAAIAPRLEAVEQIGLDWQAWKPEELTVRQVTARIRRALREGFSTLTVTGEISGLKTAASGHLYFNLKEEEVILPAVMYRQQARLMRFSLRDGMMVKMRGSIDVYEPRGAYQFLVETAEPLGAGALQAAFEALKQKLAAEGLFAAERKRPLPSFPRRIGVVTSPTGAVIQDMLNVLGRRYPLATVRLYPVLVQGAGSAEQVAEALGYFSTEDWAEVVVVARGGGSLEDLWSFNEEVVARAIAASRVPVVSAIGHETDFTIADFVADLRAPTPSAAAELLTPDVAILLRQVDGLAQAAGRGVRYQLGRWRERVLRQGVERAQRLIERRLNAWSQRTDEAEGRARNAVAARLRREQSRWQAWTLRLGQRDPRQALARQRGLLEGLQQRLVEAARRRVVAAAGRRAVLDGQLRQLNPLAVLGRGFALVKRPDGSVVRLREGVAVGERLEVVWQDGRAGVEVTDP